MRQVCATNPQRASALGAWATASAAFFREPSSADCRPERMTSSSSSSSSGSPHPGCPPGSLHAAAPPAGMEIDALLALAPGSAPPIAPRPSNSLRLSASGPADLRCPEEQWSTEELQTFLRMVREAAGMAEGDGQRPLAVDWEPLVAAHLPRKTARQAAALFQRHRAAIFVPQLTADRFIQIVNSGEQESGDASRKRPRPVTVRRDTEMRDGDAGNGNDDNDSDAIEDDNDDSNAETDGKVFDGDSELLSRRLLTDGSPSSRRVDVRPDLAAARSSYALGEESEYLELANGFGEAITPSFDRPMNGRNRSRKSRSVAASKTGGDKAMYGDDDGMLTEHAALKQTAVPLERFIRQIVASREPATEAVVSKTFFRTTSWRSRRNRRKLCAVGAEHSGLHPPTSYVSARAAADQLESQQQQWPSFCLSNPLLRRWAVAEFFKPHSDAPYFSDSEFSRMCMELGIPAGQRLTRGEWSLIRGMMGAPRRMSAKFFADEKQRIEKFRRLSRKAADGRSPRGKEELAMVDQMGVAMSIAQGQPVCFFDSICFGLYKGMVVSDSLTTALAARTLDGQQLQHLYRKPVTYTVCIHPAQLPLSQVAVTGKQERALLLSVAEEQLYVIGQDLALLTSDSAERQQQQQQLLSRGLALPPLAPASPAPVVVSLDPLLSTGAFESLCTDAPLPPSRSAALPSPPSSSRTSLVLPPGVSALPPQMCTSFANPCVHRNMPSVGVDPRVIRVLEYLLGQKSDILSRLQTMNSQSATHAARPLHPLADLTDKDAVELDVSAMEIEVARREYACLIVQLKEVNRLLDPCLHILFSRQRFSAEHTSETVLSQCRLLEGCAKETLAKCMPNKLEAPSLNETVRQTRTNAVSLLLTLYASCRQQRLWKPHLRHWKNVLTSSVIPADMAMQLARRIDTVFSLLCAVDEVS